MRRTTLALGLLLIAQGALAGGIFVHRNQEQMPGKLLAFDRPLVDGVTIDEPGQPSLVLARQSGRWVLPAMGNIPVDGTRVGGLLDSLGRLSGGWPVAQSAEAAARFKVSDQAFERKITLTSQGQAVASLLVGSSPSFRQVNVRLPGSGAIYTVPFDETRAGTRAEDWEDRSLLTVPPGDINRIELPGVTLVRDKEGLKASDLASNETMAADKLDSLVRALSTPLYEAILGSTAKPDYGLDKPAASATITLKNGRRLVYDLGKMDKGDDYVLRSSGQPYLFRLPKYAVADWLGITRTQLVQGKGTADAAPGQQRP